MLGRRLFMGRTAVQPLWERLHELALRGMNIGTGESVHSSGELGVLDVVAEPIPDSRPVVVFDVGANVGAYSASALDRLGARARVFAFEPASAAFARLKQAIGTREGVRLFDFALGDEDGVAPLFADAVGSPLGSLYPRRLAHVGLQLGLREEVRVRRLDQFCRDEAVDRIDLLKLDVEGNELRVLEGAGALLDGEAIRAVQFEFGGTNIDARTFFRDFFDVLQPQYLLYRILWDGLAPIAHYRERYEIFETTNFLAMSRVPRRA